MIITSTKNETIKQLKSLQARSRARREAGAFVIEGVRLAEEVVLSGWPVQLCLYSSELANRGLTLVDKLRTAGTEVLEAAPHVLTAASDTQSPQGILLKLKFAPLPLPESPSFVLVLDQLRDPGNIGTLLRTSAAAAVDAVLLTTGCADPFSPKVIRSGMGAHFKLPVHTMEIHEIITFCQSHNISLMLTEANSGTIYHQADLRAPLALVVGSEAVGPSPEFKSQDAEILQIPMPGESESLNAAVAASIVIFEVLRQRGKQLP